MRKFLFVRTEIFCLPHGTNFSFGAGKIFQAWKIFFPPKENSFSKAGKFLSLRRKKERPSEGKTLPSEGRKTSVRTQENFYAHRNKFSYVRKYFFFRKEFFFLAEENLFPCGRKFCAFRKEN